jgi:TrmH family RNA methyltransferase
MLRAARRLLRRKERQIARRFLAEGPQVISEALGPPNTVSELMVVEDGLDRHRDLLEVAYGLGVRVAVAPARAIAELADTVTPKAWLRSAR